jgi:hypothetical protein
MALTELQRAIYMEGLCDDDVHHHHHHMFCMRHVLEKTQECSWAARPVFTEFEKACVSVRRGVLYS